MSRRCNKQNRVSALIKKKPSKCLYEKKSLCNPPIAQAQELNKNTNWNIPHLEGKSNGY